MKQDRPAVASVKVFIYRGGGAAWPQKRGGTGLYLTLRRCVDTDLEPGSGEYLALVMAAINEEGQKLNLT